MKKVFLKGTTLTFFLTVAMCTSLGIPTTVFATQTVTVTRFTAAPNPAPSNSTIRFTFSSTNASECKISADGFFGDLPYGSGTQIFNNVYPPVTFYINCYNTGPQNSGSSGWIPLTVNLQPPDNCPIPALLSGSGYSVAPGVRNVKSTIGGTAYDFCLNNQSSQTYFVPLKTAAEYIAFLTAANGRLSGSISYFARNSGF